LLVGVLLLGCLQVLALVGRLLAVPHDPWHDLRQFAEEVADLDDEVADHGEVA
jgi:hypothetical protein